MTLITDYQLQLKAFAETLDRRGSCFVYNLPTNDILSTFTQSMTHPVIAFEDLAQHLQAPRLPNMDEVIRTAYRHELERGRSPKNDRNDKHPLIVVRSVFDPTELIKGVSRDPNEFYTRLRRLIADEDYNPGIRYLLVEDPLLEPNLSARKGTDNPLHGAVTYLDMATCEFSKELK